MCKHIDKEESESKIDVDKGTWPEIILKRRIIYKKNLSLIPAWYEIDFGRQVKTTSAGTSCYLRLLTDKFIVVRFVDLKPKSDFAPSMFIVGSQFMVGRNPINLIAPYALLMMALQVPDIPSFFISTKLLKMHLPRLEKSIVNGII